MDVEERIERCLKGWSSELDLSGIRLEEIPESVGSLTGLKVLRMRGCELTEVPDWVRNLTALTMLVLESNRLTAVPEWLGDLTDLTWLYLSDNELTDLPESLGRLTELKELAVNENRLTTLPESLSGLTKLTRLELRDNELTALPEWLGGLSALVWLDVRGNGLTSVPERRRKPAPADAALRALSDELRALLRRSGQPSVRKLASRINELPSVVHTVLHCRFLPSWAQVETLARALDGQAESLRPLWRAAYEASPERAVVDGLYQPFGGDPLTGRGRSPDSVIGDYDLVPGPVVPDGQGLEYLLGGIADHPGGVYALTYHPDGHLLATANDEGEAWLWDADLHEAVTGALTGPTREVTHLAFHPHGHLLAGAGADGTVWLWDVATGDPAAVLTSDNGHQDGITKIAFHPDGHLLAGAGAGGTVSVWHLDSGRPAMEPFACHTGPVWAMAFHPDGRALVTAGCDLADETTATLRWHDLSTGASDTRVLAGQNVRDAVAVFDPDVTRLATAAPQWYEASASRWDYTSLVRLWDPATGEPAGDPFQSVVKNVSALAFHPDGRLLAIGGHNYGAFAHQLQVWDPVTGAYRLLFASRYGQPDHAYTLAFHPGGQVLAHGDLKDSNGVQFWATTAKPVGAPLLHTDPVPRLFFHPDGRSLATMCHARALRLWDPATGEPLKAPPTPDLVDVALGPGGDLLAASDTEGVVRLWDWLTHKPVGIPMAGHSIDDDLGMFKTMIAFHPDGHLLATTDFTFSPITGYRGIVWLWDVATGELADCFTTDPIRQTFQPDPIRQIAFHPGGELLLYTTPNGTQIRHLATGELICDPLPSGPIAFHPVSHLLATNEHGALRLWDPFTGERVGVPLTGDVDACAIAFHPDGEMVATGHYDGTLRLWDMATGGLLGAPLAGHYGGIEALAFHPDGNLLASSGADWTARLWISRGGRR
ncbi:hypothetical protein [Streptosporangium sp. NPDC049644]|uniref:WD40 domain-containing protein n=1 Tax=Streptosporangium sp. NPDC049644 TaxID=3155507 RepID=UPI00341DC40A